MSVQPGYDGFSFALELLIPSIPEKKCRDLGKAVSADNKQQKQGKSILIV